MPQCPKCQATFEEGQRYCNQCESYLLHADAGDILCPQCGIRVAPGQEFCHKCSAALPPTAKAAPSQSTPSSPQGPPRPAPVSPPPPLASPPPIVPAGTPRPGLPPWVYAVFGGMGVIIVVLLVLLLWWSMTPPPAPAPPAAIPGAPVQPPAAEESKPVTPPGTEEARPAKPEVPQPPPAQPESTEVKPPAPEAGEAKPEITKEQAKEATLEQQLEEVLMSLREAQMKKDIVLYMSCYSYMFPNLDQKRKNALKYWDSYTFNQLLYSLENVKPMGEDQVSAKVTWKIQTLEKDQEEPEESTQTYQVVFAKELGKWRIRALKELD